MNTPSLRNDRADLDIRHDPALHRFECTVEGHRCVADYRLADGVMLMTHTGVHPSLEGQGIAAALVATAIEYARIHRLKINPLCSYVGAYMRRHPDTLDLLA